MNLSHFDFAELVHRLFQNHIPMPENDPNMEATPPPAFPSVLLTPPLPPLRSKRVTNAGTSCSSSQRTADSDFPSSEATVFSELTPHDYEPGTPRDQSIVSNVPGAPLGPPMLGLPSWAQ